MDPDPAPPFTQRAAFMAWALKDFRRFCGLLQVRAKSGLIEKRLQMALTPAQRRYNKARTSRDIILKPRQIYMTTLEAARDLWWFLTKPGAHVVLVCQSQGDQAALKDNAEKFRIFFDSLARLGLRLDFGAHSRTEWTLPARDASLRLIQAGASEISAGRKGRGGTVNRLHFTEAAFFERAQDTFNSLMESVPTEGSEVVNESTPNGAAGFYYNQWTAAVNGQSAFKPHFFQWWLHPEYRMELRPGTAFEPETELEKQLLGRGIPPENLLWYRHKIREKGGDTDLVLQEYPSDPETCFLIAGRGFFDGEAIAQMLANAREPEEALALRTSGIKGEVIDQRRVPVIRIWHQPVQGRDYVLALDTSEGVGKDASAGILLDRGIGKHMATIWGQLKPWELAHLAVYLAKRFNYATIAVERNNHGHACLRALTAEEKYTQVFVDRDTRPGWVNSHPARTSAIDALEAAHRGRHFVTLDRHLLTQMRTFVVHETGKIEAEAGAHDDLVMATAIAWDVCCRIRPRRDFTNLPHA